MATPSRPKDPVFFERVPTPFGTIGIVWWEATRGPRVHQLILTRDRTPAVMAIRAVHPIARAGSCAPIARLARELRHFFAGEPIVFDLGIIALERCGEFQRRVLLAEHGIPRGRVSTYGRMAEHLGVPGGARAVGRALARNPFPVVIPCHRAVRTDGDLGGYQGGVPMKRALLEMEGVAFTEAGRVRMDRVHY
jgi:methylated-DNA-[protein]-cysteine S-methyltransferase